MYSHPIQKRAGNIISIHQQPIRGSPPSWWMGKGIMPQCKKKLVMKHYTGPWNWQALNTVMNVQVQLNVSILSQMHPIHSNIISNLCRIFQVMSSLLVFQPKFCINFSSLPCILPAPPHLILLDFVTLTYSVKCTQYEAPHYAVHIKQIKPFFLQKMISLN
jgi:hypothetical protein